MERENPHLNTHHNSNNEDLTGEPWEIVNRRAKKESKYNKSSALTTKGEGVQEQNQRLPLFNTVSKQKGFQEVNQDEGKGDEKGKHHPSYNVVNFFFTNFPPDWNKADLHELFAEVGEIADLYVARKVSKSGKKFGFARFFRVGSLRALENRLNRIRIGNFNLRANIAMFEKPISHYKEGSKRDEWVFDVPCKSKQSPMFNLSSSLKVDESFVIHSLFELQSIWSSFNTTNCKVNYMGGSKFSIEFKNEEGDRSPRVGVRCVEDGVKVDVESNNIIKSGPNGTCGEVNDLKGMDMKCINTSTKAEENVTFAFPKQVKGGDSNFEFNIDSKDKQEHANVTFASPKQVKGENSNFEFNIDSKDKHEHAFSSGNGNDLSPHLVDDIIKNKSKLCHTTKQKGESKCYDTTKEKDETKEKGVDKCYDIIKQKDESKCYLSPSTPPGTDINAEESCSTWLDYVSPLITDELDFEKRWSYRDPNGNIQGPFSLAQLRRWKDFFPSDIKIWSYYGNVKKTILLHSALKRRSKDVG